MTKGGKIVVIRLSTMGTRRGQVMRIKVARHLFSMLSSVKDDVDIESAFELIQISTNSAEH